MKYLSTIAAVAALASSAGNAAANSNNNSNSTAVSVAPVAHGSSAPAPSTPVAPHISGVPHSLNGIPQHYPSGTYRPTVTYPNGNRVLVYPAVTGSSGHHSTPISPNGNTPALHHSGGRNLQHTATVNIAAKNRLNPQTSARLRNWNGNVSTSAQAQQNHLNNLKHHHDHNWWHHHCIAFIFWDWGWWGWWDGWWYPAWGYDPYSYYGYNEPMYGYEGLSPEQIVANVQAELQQRGYYSYAVDGQMGAQTRSAIARYQRDHHLPITYGIDPATLGSLGLIQ